MDIPKNMRIVTQAIVSAKIHFYEGEHNNHLEAYPLEKNAEAWEDFLNEMAFEGWIYVGVVPGEYKHLIFRRVDTAVVRKA